MNKIAKSLAVIVAVAGVAGGLTYAYFSDIETSNANNFSAGTMDLTLDGKNNENDQVFNVSNAIPNVTQSIAVYHLKNIGSVNGFVDLKNISVESKENGCTGPEKLVDGTCGDPGNGDGELQKVSNFDIFVDENCNGWYGSEDNKFFSGRVGDIASSYDLNLPLNAGQEKCITVQYDWWSTPDDNKAQGDSMSVNFGFALDQIQ